METAVTLPSCTVATDELSQVQIRFLLVAFSGVTVAVKVATSPSVSSIDVLSKTTPVTGYFLSLTVIEQLAVIPPSSVFTVTTAVPVLIAVTLPSSTVATDGSSDDHVTFLFVAFSGLTVAVNTITSPSTISKDVLFKETPVTAYTLAWTFTEQVAVLPPSSVVTVIVALPFETAVTLPSCTVATDELSEVQIRFLLVAFSGVIVAVKVATSPSVSSIDVLSKTTPVTGYFLSLTVIEQLAVIPPSSVFTVTTAVPLLRAVTLPSSTVATDGSSDDHVTFLFVAFSGLTVAVNTITSPSTISREVLFKDTPVTGYTFSLTDTEHVAVFPPSSVLTVITALPLLTAVTLPFLTVATAVLLDDHDTVLS